jgi:hypothetical protein
MIEDLNDDIKSFVYGSMQRQRFASPTPSTLSLPSHGNVATNQVRIGEKQMILSPNHPGEQQIEIDHSRCSATHHNVPQRRGGPRHKTPMDWTDCTKKTANIMACSSQSRFPRTVAKSKQIWSQKNTFSDSHSQQFRLTRKFRPTKTHMKQLPKVLLFCKHLDFQDLRNTSKKTG